MEMFHKQFSIEDYSRAISLYEDNKAETSDLPWELDIDVYSFLTMDCEVFTMEDGESIVGYAIFLVDDHPHYQKRAAFQNVLYVHPKYRGLSGIKFLKFIESSLRDISVEGIFQSSTTKKDISPLLKRMGYQETERVYFKEL